MFIEKLSISNIQTTDYDSGWVKLGDNFQGSFTANIGIDWQDAVGTLDGTLDIYLKNSNSLDISKIKAYKTVSITAATSVLSDNTTGLYAPFKYIRFVFRHRRY